MSIASPNAVSRNNVIGRLSTNWDHPHPCSVTFVLGTRAALLARPRPEGKTTLVLTADGAATRSGTAVPLARRPVAVVAALYAALMFSVAANYGLSADELYFRMLGDVPRWGYFDQPPLAPLLAKAGALLLGDTVW